MRITVISLGSTGDVRPATLLGQELKKRGHEVTVAAFQELEKTVTDAGLLFFPIRGNVLEMMKRIMKPGNSWVNYLPELEKALGSTAPQMLSDLMASCEHADAMVCNYFGSMYYSVAEKFNIPCVQFNLFVMDPNDNAPVTLAPMQNIDMGKGWNRFTYHIAYLLIGEVEKKYLTPWRKENGVSVRKIKPTPDYRIGSHTVPVLYAISPLVFPRPATWQNNIQMTGYWFDERASRYEPPEELVNFLADGPAPVYIGFGSMDSGDMNKTMAIVLKAVHAARLRAVIATGWSGLSFHIKATKNVCFVKYVSHDWLFPRVQAVVHHGGAGTTAAGLRYGKPTLVVPFGGDQTFWGLRIHEIGCGPKPVARAGMTVQKLTRALLDLTGQKKYRSNAEKIAEGLAKEHGTTAAADLMEKEFDAWYGHQET